MHSIKIIHEIIEEGRIKVGSSKIGGCPDLPPDIEWPLNNDDEPLAFLAQFNLGELAPYDFKGVLPSKGMLYFFYDVDSAAWGFDPTDAGRWKVIFYQEDGFFRMTHPEGIPEESMFKSCVLRFFDEITVPPLDSLIIEQLGLTKKEQEIYFDLTEKISELNGNSGTINRLLGYPDQIQGEMQLECQLVTQGIYCGDSTCGDVPGLPGYKKDAEEWRLLFQLDSLEDIGMMWGDLGRIYYWIKKRDLVENCFDNVWLILQCG